MNNAMSKRQRIDDYSSFGRSLPDIVGPSGTRGCYPDDRTECSGTLSYQSRKRWLGTLVIENIADACGNASPKRQHVSRNKHNENTLTPKNHRTSAGASSSVPIDISGGRTDYKDAFKRSNRFGI